jgi:hypothetical protein
MWTFGHAECTKVRWDPGKETRLGGKASGAVICAWDTMRGDWWWSSWDATLRRIPGSNELAFYLFRIPNVLYELKFDKCISDWRNAQDLTSLCVKNRIRINSHICVNVSCRLISKSLWKLLHRLFHASYQTILRCVIHTVHCRWSKTQYSTNKRTFIFYILYITVSVT